MRSASVGASPLDGCQTTSPPPLRAGRWGAVLVQDRVPIVIEHRSVGDPLTSRRRDQRHPTRGVRVDGDAIGAEVGPQAAVVGRARVDDERVGSGVAGTRAVDAGQSGVVIARHQGPGRSVELDNLRGRRRRLGDRARLSILAPRAGLHVGEVGLASVRVLSDLEGEARPGVQGLLGV